MKGTRLGCLSGTGILAALVTALAIVGYGFADGGVMFSPGALNAVPGQPLGGYTSHAEIDGNCDACHVAPWAAESMDDRCLVCHTDVAAGLKDLTDIHGRLLELDPSTTCRECHPEHHGRMASLTVLDRWNFPHEVTGYSLTGHQMKAEDEPFKCDDCHSGDIRNFDVQTCKRCHAQTDTAFVIEHMVAFGDSCLKCHDGVDKFGDDFNHSLFKFALLGKHANVACSHCHLNQFTLAAVQATKQDCVSCHQPDDPHKGELGTNCASCHSVDGWKPAHFDHNRSVFKLTGGHAMAACASCHKDLLFKGTPTDCFSCHQLDDPHQGMLGTKCESCHQPSAWTTVTFDHSTSAFPLLGLHKSVECESCHTDKLFKGTPKDCFSCHSSDDPHRGQLGPDCAKCHTPDGWTPAHFDHNLAAFRLTGAHTDVACESCHVNKVYRGIPKNCFGCHAAHDAHAGQFGTDCAACHATSSWRDVTFDHNSTAFPLVASHANVQCNACHVNGVFRGTASDCYSCHANQDAHNGQFGTDCSACHQPTRWQDASFDHNRSAFPLTGRHQGLTCNSCHQSGQFRGLPSACAACHGEPAFHAGAFGSACDQCHTTSAWTPAQFNLSHSSVGGDPPLQHHGATCRTCHTSTVHEFTCLACHDSNNPGG